MRRFVGGKWLAGLLVLAASILLALGALAQDSVYVIQADKLDMTKLNDSDYVEENLSAATQYIRVTYALSGASQVKLSVVRADTGTVVLQKNYGQKSGLFKSDDIYLKYSGSGTVAYTITLSVNNTNYTFPFYRKLMVLKNNTACTFGVRIKSLDKSLTDAWTMATPLDLEAIAATPGGTQRINLCASNMYVIGTVSVRIRDGVLRVSMQLEDEEDGKFEIADQHLYLITSPAQWDTLDPKRTALPEYEIGVDIPLSEELSGVRYVVLYLPMKLTYDPNGLSRFGYDTKQDPELIQELTIWDAMKELDEQGAIG